MVLKCIVCTEPIPSTRRKDSVTCSPECAKIRMDYERARQQSLRCVYCHRPASAEEQERYARWRRWEKMGKTDEQSAQNLLRENIRLKAELKAAKEGV